MKNLTDTPNLIYNYKQSIIIIINILSCLYLAILFIYININALKMIQSYNRLKKIFIIIKLSTVMLVTISQ